LKLHNKDRQSTMIKASQDWLLKEGRDGRFEVDLHIEELLEDTSGMENADIIRYQLRYFEKCLDEAQRRPVKRFVVIHGVGKGRLRDEIRKQLSADNIEHYDAPLSKYGFGATEIIIR
jgi:dsDNA-specific endonuclease/ATPase MutS2